LRTFLLTPYFDEGQHSNPAASPLPHRQTAADARHDQYLQADLVRQPGIAVKAS
jgi:hypothetical protein